MSEGVGASVLDWKSLLGVLGGFLNAFWRLWGSLGRLLNPSWEGFWEPFGKLRGVPGTSQGPAGRHMGHQNLIFKIFAQFCEVSRSVSELKNCIFNIKNIEKVGSKRRSAKGAFFVPIGKQFCIDLEDNLM